MRVIASLGIALFVTVAACGGDDGRPGADAGTGADSGAALDAAPGVDASVATDAGAPPVDAGGTLDAAPPGDAGITFACTLEELTPIGECAAMHCVSLPDGGLADASLPDPTELATCILSNCGTLLLAVSPGCRDCLVAGVGMNVSEITMRCADGVPAM